MPINHKQMLLNVIDKYYNNSESEIGLKDTCRSIINRLNNEQTKKMIRSFGKPPFSEDELNKSYLLKLVYKELVNEYQLEAIG